jgi:hypothetical protein
MFVFLGLGIGIGNSLYLGLGRRSLYMEIHPPAATCFKHQITSSGSMKLVRFKVSGHGELKRMPKWPKRTQLIKHWPMTYSGKYYDWTLSYVKVDNISWFMC